MRHERKSFKFVAVVASLLLASILLASCGTPVDNDAIQSATNDMNARIDEILATESVYDENATIYYVSVDGHDVNNDGLSPESPFASPLRANQVAKEGDVVLFKRGDEWRLRWTTNPGVTYSAYGEGPKPVFNGNKYGDAADPSHWTLLEGTDNIWKYKNIIPDVGCIVFNEGETVGEKLHLEIYEKEYYLWSPNGPVPFNYDNGSFTQNLHFVSDYVHVTNDGADMNTPARLYLRCDEGNPGEVFDSIELMYRGTLITGKSGVTLDNLCIKYSGGHGIGMGSVDDFTVTNCEVGWIGGSAQFYTNHYVIRFGNGIEVYGGCKNYTVDNCYVHDCYDAGLTHQRGNGDGENPIYHDTVRFTDNVITKCIYGIEFFLGCTESGSLDERVMRDVLYKGNYIAYTGEGFGYDPSRAAGLKGWDNNNHTEDFVVEENVFLLNKTDAWHIGTDNIEWFPTFRNNTYIQAKGTGYARFGRPVNGEYVSTRFMYDSRISKAFDIIGETGATVIYAPAQK